MDDLLLDMLGALLLGLKAGLPLLGKALRLVWVMPGHGLVGGSVVSVFPGRVGFPGRLAGLRSRAFHLEALRQAWHALGLGTLLSLGHVLADAQFASVDLSLLRRSLAMLVLPRVALTLDPVVGAAGLGLAACLLFGLSLRRFSSSGYTWGVVPALGRACRVRHLGLPKDW